VDIDKMVTVYEFPLHIPDTHTHLYEDVLGVIKLPGRVWETDHQHKTWFCIFLMLDKEEKHRLVPTAMVLYERAVVPITETTRTVMIELLKIAIQNTMNVLSKYPSNVTFDFQRQLYMDVILNAEIYLEELMYAEAAERAQVAAAKKIQRAFLSAITAPSHPFCQRRLMREFDELVMGVM
jgi:hypothetical protein